MISKNSSLLFLRNKNSSAFISPKMRKQLKLDRQIGMTKKFRYWNQSFNLLIGAEIKN
ncbi:hypothetical protein LEP1GSC060_2575 [Leptospira weilii serovar Ranarum str. ICFT]|uniref:Uncharacterized protein n=1 Tax=Leptospira weilii serovar Ranarum str. ICFT TaxID=1218598 RepID=N1WQV1_9LEPT|nr:hypothetical protein LEP1GSC060_2575 [Leptospira weilii serovar Ranarum str. ICFT]